MEIKNNKMAKRFWALLLVFALVLSLLPLDVFRSEAAPGDGGDGNLEFLFHFHDDDEPIRDAEVLIAYEESAAKTVAGTTDPNGDFLLTGIPVGSTLYYRIQKDYQVADGNVKAEDGYKDVTPEKVSINCCVIETSENGGSYGVGIAGATVSLKNTRTNEKSVFTTDEDGCFTIENVYEIDRFNGSVTKDNYYSSSISSFGYSVGEAVHPIQMTRKKELPVTLEWNAEGNVTVPWNDPVTRQATCVGAEPAVIAYAGKIEYSSDNADVASVDESSGKVTLMKSGTVKIFAKIKETADFQGVSISYTINAEKINRNSNLRFEKSGNQKVEVTTNTFSNKAICTGTYSISYSSSNTDIATVDSNGVVTINSEKKMGETVIKAVISEDDKYFEETATYKLTVGRATQSVYFEKGDSPDAIPYGYVGFQNKMMGVGQGATVTYSSDNANVATVDQDGTITTVGVGEAVISAQSTQYLYYKERTISYTLVVKKADQQINLSNNVFEVAFDKTNNKYTNEAEAVNKYNTELKTGIHPTYEIIKDEEDPEFAVINGTTGVVTIKKANGAQGALVKVKVSFAGNAYYNAESKEYTLKIKRGTQSIKFPQTDYAVTTGNAFKAPTASNSSGVNSGTGTITYSCEQFLEDGTSTETICTIDTNGGISFLDGYVPGTVIVTAIKAADDDYEAATAQYTLVVTNDVVQNGAWWVEGTQTPNEWYKNKDWSDCWYISKPETIYITCVKSKQLCLEADLKKNPQDVVWKDSLVGIIPTDGEYYIYFRVKDVASGRVSGVQTAHILCDSTKPTVEVSEKTGKISGWDSFLKIITFGNWQPNSGIDLLITAKDEVANDSVNHASGVERCEYLIVENTVDRLSELDLDTIYDQEKDSETKKWKTLYSKHDFKYSGVSLNNLSIHLDNDIHFIVYVRVTDDAGNWTYNIVDGREGTDAIIFENYLPKIEITEITKKVEGTDFFNQNVQLHISVNDHGEDGKTPYSGIKEVRYSITYTNRSGTSFTTDYAPLYKYTNYTAVDTDEDGMDDYAKLDPGQYDDLKYQYDQDIFVYANSYNYDSVKVTVVVEDLAGNKSVQNHDLKISIGQPSINISFNETESPRINTYEDETEIVDYYNKARTATVTITGRDSVWKPENAIIYVTEIKDDSLFKNPRSFESTHYEKQQDETWSFNGWSYVPEAEQNNGDKDQHVATINFDGNAKYLLRVEYTDVVGTEAISKQSSVFVVDKESATKIDLTPKGTTIGKHGDADIFIGDVDVTINVEDQPFSRIKNIDCQVACEGTDTQAFSFLPDIYSFEQTVQVNAEQNNNCNVRVEVTVTDYANNTTSFSIPLDIDVIAPSISVRYDNNKDEVQGYFDADRTATITITERTAHFDAIAATNGIKITAKNYGGKDVLDENQCKALINGWSTREFLGDSNAATHIATIYYSQSANYEFTVEYTDMAGLKNIGVDTEDSKSPFVFTVDKNDPTGLVSVSIKDEPWYSLISVLTFGLWSNEPVQVRGKVDDETSPIMSVDYYKTDETTAKSTDELAEITGWKTFDVKNGFRVSPDERFVVYLRIRDSAGNTSYISTDGVIVDKEVPDIKKDYIKPEITINPEQPVNGIYNRDVHTTIHVEDPDIRGAYSGLKSIKYKVLNMGKETQRDELYNFEDECKKKKIEKPLQSDLQQALDLSIDVVAADNNSNDVEIHVIAEDNAGNVYEEFVTIQIDITKPTINVSYDNNDGDTSFADGTTDAYFKATRTATITIFERNFDPSSVVVTITNTDGTIPSITGWGTIEAGGNGDQNANTATITYSADGDYSFDISYVDQAGNPNDPVNYSGLAPQKFTIDQTIPTITVSYDNNDVSNERYYKAGRTATLTIVEHNFETSRVQVPISASDNGVTKTAPSISGWSSNGDTHVATIVFEEDALYGFDVEYSDKAGNTIADFEQQSFYVDLINPEVEISKIWDESANNNSGSIGFEIQATDTNFDVFEPVVTVVIYNGSSFETKTVDLGQPISIDNGQRYVVDNLELDGIYRITCNVVDKAGNAYSEVKLNKKDGSTYKEQRSGSDTLITFSVNRQGSAFELDEKATKLINQYYVKHVTDDVVIYEINADPLQEYTISLNGNDLSKSQYVVDRSIGEGGWSKYSYTLNKDLFDAEGEYNIVVYSKDKAENDAFSDVKGASLRFVVDRTAPVVSVSGLESGGRYQTQLQKVTLVPTDDGGALKAIRVILVDDNGNELRELLHFENDELKSALESNDGKLTFEIEEGLYQNVRIVCLDMASEIEDVKEVSASAENENVYNQLFEDVSVTSNTFLIFWANRPLRWSVIIGIVLLIAAGVFFVVMKRRKNQTTGVQ